MKTPTTAPLYKIGQKLQVRNGFKNLAATVKKVILLNNKWVYCFDSKFKPTYESELEPYDSFM